jgi:hypothetical protein
MKKLIHRKPKMDLKRKFDREMMIEGIIALVQKYETRFPRASDKLITIAAELRRINQGTSPHARSAGHK